MIIRNQTKGDKNSSSFKIYYMWCIEPVPHKPLSLGLLVKCVNIRDITYPIKSHKQRAIKITFLDNFIFNLPEIFTERAKPKYQTNYYLPAILQLVN